MGSNIATVLERNYGWNKNVFGEVEVQFEEATKRVELVDLKSEEMQIDEAEILSRKEVFQEM